MPNTENLIMIGIATFSKQYNDRVKPETHNAPLSIQLPTISNYEKTSSIDISTDYTTSCSMLLTYSSTRSQGMALEVTNDSKSSDTTNVQNEHPIQADSNTLLSASNIANDFVNQRLECIMSPSSKQPRYQSFELMIAPPKQNITLVEVGLEPEVEAIQFSKIKELQSEDTKIKPFKQRPMDCMLEKELESAFTKLLNRTSAKAVPKNDLNSENIGPTISSLSDSIKSLTNKRLGVVYWAGFEKGREELSILLCDEIYSLLEALVFEDLFY